MISGWLLVLISISYISVLFLIAWAGDRHPGLYRKRMARTHIYALSLAVYFTSWTFYGAVGRATQEGLGFLPIYLGPLTGLSLWRLPAPAHHLYQQTQQQHLHCRLSLPPATANPSRWRR